MSEYKITCCSTIDLPEEFLTERGIPCVPYHFEMDGTDYEDDFGKSMSSEEFYARIDAGSMPVTSQVNVEEYINFLTPFLDEGYDVLHFAMSSGISGSANSAMIARDELAEKYPDRKIFVVDTLCVCSGYGLLMHEAWKLKEQGMSIDDLAKWAEENKRKSHHWFYSTNLTHYWRGGRVSRASAVVGTLLNIIPILNVNFEGKLIPREKLRGKKAVTKKMFENMKAHAVDGTAYSGKCYIAHSACFDDARALADMIEAEFENLDGGVEISNIGKVIGAHTGPGTVALFFWGDERVD